jgi:predicted transcriptional regulator of viral defense system
LAFLKRRIKKAMEMAYKHKKITTKALADTLDRSTKFTRVILSSLHKKGILSWNGTSPTDPQQYYYIEN